MEAQERGWSFRDDRFVCDECVKDEFLKEVVRDSATEEECSFCDRLAEEPIAAPVDYVMEHVGAAFYSVYTDPVHVAGYCSQEGGYLVATREVDDAVEGILDDSILSEIGGEAELEDRIECPVEERCPRGVDELPLELGVRHL